MRALTPLGAIALAAACAHARPAAPSGGASPLQMVALRADQAPIVGLRDLLEVDSLLGRRVRVAGWCAAAPGLLAGRRAGLWIMSAQDTTMEVRGLVPRACEPALKAQILLLIFAQVEAAAPGRRDRLLLRLPE